ncbi:ubiquitin-conjugating enzyme E2 Z-like [Cimex lectularius]|uniref:Ubiquitin-conjugating enzyme E2 Z n=1 Tax=Cimex lectularius TaxID=79782 RepID=A0A8I6S2S4_CIMLE|nr:ubiquitin-conjugating enzyme E2 Z-like [Cimex lectularius]
MLKISDACAADGEEAAVDKEPPGDWDPTAPAASKESPPAPDTVRPTRDPAKSLQCIPRVKRDMLAIYQDPPPGIFVIQDEKDITLIHALITGSFDTPYTGGFFYFLVKCPPDYPIKPPKVKFMTTAGGSVRFNPNLYKCGKVCISILGTWSGPPWSPALTISSVLISIQSLLTEKPYHNEPGFERERFPGDSRRYNEIIQYETIRVAVCGMLENDYGLNIPKPFMEAMNHSFIQFYEYYESAVKAKLQFSGCAMQDPFGEARGTFDYKGLLARLQAIYNRLKSSEGDEISTSSSSGDSD